MKYCSSNIKSHCVLAGLVALLVTGYTSAADKKLSPVQKILPTNSSHSVRLPVKVKTPLVVPASKRQAVSKPAKKSVGTVAAPSVVVKKKQSPGIVLKPTGIPPRTPVRVPVKSSRQPVKPVIVAPRAVNTGAGFSHKTSPPIQTPVLLTPPARQVQPVAPALLNPRHGGLTPPVMNPQRQAGNKPAQRSKASPSTPARGFGLSPLTRPDSGAAVQGTGAGRHAAGSSSASHNASGQGGFASVPGVTDHRSEAGSVQGDNRGTESGAAPGTATGSGSSPAPSRGGFVPTTDSHGKRMFGTGDATRIPATGSDGQPGRVNGDGSVSYGDGMRVEHNDQTGETVITKPDGQVIVQHRGDTGTPTNPDYNPELGVGPGNDPNRSAPPEYSEEEDTFSYSDGAGIKGSKNGQRGRVQENGDILFSDGTRYSHNTGTGRTTVIHPDGSSDIYEDDSGKSSRRSGHLHTGPGVDSTPSDDGGTDVYDRETGTSAHFGGGGVANGGMANAKYDSETDTYDYGDGTHVPARGPSGERGKVSADGYTVMYGDGTLVRHDSTTGETQITHPDGTKTVQHQGDGRPLDASSRTSDSESDTQSSDSSDDNSSSSDEGSDDNSSSDSSSDDSSADSSDSDSSNDDNADSSDDSDSSDDDSADDDSSSDESRAGFEGGRGSDGRPEAAAKTTVDDRVARMRGEKRDPESPEDSVPGNGGSAPDSVSQPGPSGAHRGSPLARPSTEGRQSPVNVVVPTVKSRASVGGGDCFQRDGCDNAPTGDFLLDPFNRDPVTNPGGH